jgi:ribosome-binding protein aMBF1 (putative translation factor)
MKKATDKELSVLEKHEVKTDWRERAEWRRENRRWLRYSGFIALTVMRRLEELKLNQKELAEKMNCSPQYVSKLLKGSENLTLDTISKLEESLDLDLIRSALTHVEGYDSHEHSYSHVAEPDPPYCGSKKE